MNTKTRIRLYGVHIGYISSRIVNLLIEKHDFKNINDWIKIQAFNDFGIFLDSENKIEDLTDSLIENDYEDICDWIREKIRISMK